MSYVRSIYLWLASLLLLAFACSSCSTAATVTPGNTRMINVVAAENFYGDIARQLGGSHVAVTSILSDPNVDPHQYEANVQATKAVSSADLVIENGDGYDDWMDKLLASAPNSKRIVLTAAHIAGHKLPDNAHVWYGIDNVKTITQTIADALRKLDKTDSTLFASNLQTFQKSLEPLQQKLGSIRQKYSGTPVGLTETIYLYQTQPMGLKMLTPFDFQKAIAEGNDPPADTVATTMDQVNHKQIKILIYNVQTNTPVTTNLQHVAQSKHIPVVPISETMPGSKTYQQWMMDQLNAVEQALAQTTGY